MNPLQSALEELADDAPRPSPHPELWDRGRGLRRRDRLVRSGLVLVVVLLVGGLATLVTGRPAAVAPAGDVVPDGAIPSRIVEPEGPVLTDLAFGRASVAYVDEFGQPFLVSATTGETRPVDLPGAPVLPRKDARTWFRGPWLALSPDGDRLVYPVGESVERVRGVTSIAVGFYCVVDLTTGETDLVDRPPGTGMPLAISWTADGQIAVDVFGRATRRTSATHPPDAISWTVDPTTGDSRRSPLTGVVAPGKGISATYPEDASAVRAVPFASADGDDLLRDLPADLYPDGAAVTPVGWAAGDLLVAEVDAPAGSYVAGRHLVLFTSPDRPKSEWTYRILVRDLPDGIPMSVAVDLIPDLDGTSSQQLTHDFASYDVGVPDGVRWGGTAIAGLAVLLTAYVVWRRERRLG
ncbi:hypothetical protein [Nocardioides sp. P5_C9_2]